jgi:hypothetical protein
MKGANKLECLYLAGFPSQVQHLWARPGAYPRVEHLKDVLLRLALSLL